MLERNKLVPLRLFGQRVVVGKQSAETILLKTFQQPRRTGHLAAAEIAIKPPGHFFRKFRQPPVPEFRDQDRLGACALGIAIRTVGPVRTVGQL